LIRHWRIFLLLFSLVTSAAAQEPETPQISPAIRSRTKAKRDYAIIVANETYASLPQVRWALDDGAAVYDYLRNTRGVSKWRIRYVKNASHYRLKSYMKKGRYNSSSRGTLWVYFSGHGYVDEDGQRILLGVDANPMDPSAKGLSLGKIISDSARGKASQVVIILDTGFGNQGRDGLELVPGAEIQIPSGFGELPEKVFIWAADQRGGPAAGYQLARHGLHTYTVLGALRGWADGAIDGERDGEISIAEAQRFTTRTQRHLGRPTDPSMDERSEILERTMVSGRYFERPPAPEQFSLLAQHDLATRIDELQARIKAEANALWQATVLVATEDDEGAEDALSAFLDEYEFVTVQLDWAVHIPEAVEARKLLTRIKAKGAEAIDEAADDVRLASCDNLVELESAAGQGRLNQAQIECLEYRLVREPLQTTRVHVSMVLIINAQRASDQAAWERLVSRHLEDYDRSNPDLCFSYAVFLHRLGADRAQDAHHSGVEQAEEAIHWADVALQNKQVWPAGAYKKKVYALLKLRAEASTRLWNSASERYADEPTRENDAMVNEYKSMALSMTREWLDYARASDQPSETALQMCASAAGTLEACR
jgi:hypothetical protein